MNISTSAIIIMIIHGKDSTERVSNALRNQENWN